MKTIELNKEATSFDLCQIVNTMLVECGRALGVTEVAQVEPELLAGMRVEGSRTGSMQSEHHKIGDRRWWIHYISPLSTSAGVFRAERIDIQIRSNDIGIEAERSIKIHPLAVGMAVSEPLMGW